MKAKQAKQQERSMKKAEDAKNSKGPKDKKGGKGGNDIKKTGKTRHSKSINDSKLMKDFNERGHRRHNKEIAKKGKPDFIDKRKKLAHKGRRNEEDVDDEHIADMSDVESSEEFDEEMKQVDAELDEIDSDNLNEDEFVDMGGELDLPSEEGDDDEEDEDMASESDEDMDAYCRDIGVDPSLLKDEKKSKKEQPEGTDEVRKEKKVSARALVVDNMLDAVRQAVNQVDSSKSAEAHQNNTLKVIKRVVTFVKQVFTDRTDDDEGDEDKPAKKQKGKQQHIGQALNSAEYLKLLQFFTGELPALMLKAFDIPEPKHKKQNIVKMYAGLSRKQTSVLQSYAANLTKLITEALNESNYIGHFYQDPTSIVRCVLPFKTYRKKLAIQSAKIVASYSKVNNKATILLAFQALNNIVHATCEDALFEVVMKKLYNEFTRESKVGGGSLLVQDSLRITQNCIVELLSFNRSIGYQLGFQYIRQLCLHLRTIRTKLTPESLKQIYSWQFYNCMKVWVLALTSAQTSDLILLVNPLVQLIIGTMRLTTNLKYFPFHLKCFELLSEINKKTQLFVPAAQYIMHVLDTVNNNFFNSKPKPMTDKIVPDFFISLKISKKHLPTQEIKDRIIKETVDALTHWFAANATSLSFPELAVPNGVMVRKFKKNVQNQVYRKTLQSLLDLIKRNEEVVANERAKIRDKSLKDPAKLTQQWSIQITGVDMPLVKESAKLEARQIERINMKIAASQH